MFTCHACTRHVLEDTRACPFCGAAQRSMPSPIHGGFGGGLITAVLGLVLVSCGDPDPDDGGASTTATSSPGDTTADPTSGSAGSTAAGATAGSGDTYENEAADYGGPTGEPPPDTGTTGGTETDTGSTTGEPGMETEGADYGGPASSG